MNFRDPPVSNFLVAFWLQMNTAISTFYGLLGIKTEVPMVLTDFLTESSPEQLAVAFSFTENTFKDLQDLKNISSVIYFPKLKLCFSHWYFDDIMLLCRPMHF